MLFNIMLINPKSKSIATTRLIIIGFILIAGSGYWFWVDDIKPKINDTQSNSDYVLKIEALCKETRGVYRACPPCPKNAVCAPCPPPCNCLEGKSWSNENGCVSEANTIDTFDWQTYRNEKYNYEITYPPNFIVYSGFDNKGEVINAIAEAYKIYIGKDSERLRNIGEFSLGIRVFNTSLAPREWFQKNQFRFKSITNTSFLGYPGIEILGFSSVDSFERSIIFRAHNKLFVITNAVVTNPYNQILSTFKFIE